MIADKSCKDFVEVLASDEPTPGGGGASALVAAIGTALGNMVGSLTEGKLKYYEVEAFRNTQDATRKHAISNVLLWVAGGIGVAGFGVFASGLFIEDEGRGRICRYVGEGLLVGALASVGFSYGFDISANGSRIKAQYYNQKLADYKKRHSAMGNE